MKIYSSIILFDREIDAGRLREIFFSNVNVNKKPAVVENFPAAFHCFSGIKVLTLGHFYLFFFFRKAMM